MEKIINDLNDLDWEDFADVSFHTQKVLRNIFFDRTDLNSLLESVLDNKELILLCEHYEFFDKIVLYKDKFDRFRIRLHIFLSETSNKDRLHYHRWIYSSIILRGGYKHLIYGLEKQFDENTDVRNIGPLLVQEERVGSVYTINHDVVHSIEAEPDTVSLFIRGTAIKDRFLIMDRRTNKKWWEYGRDSETIEEIRKKAMPIDRLRRIINKIRDDGLI